MATYSPKQARASRGMPGEGKSKAAAQRRERSQPGRIHGGPPGSTFKIGNTVYAVAKDGSFRRGRELAALGKDPKLSIQTPNGEFKALSSIQEMHA